MFLERFKPDGLVFVMDFIETYKHTSYVPNQRISQLVLILNGDHSRLRNPIHFVYGCVFQERMHIDFEPTMRHSKRDIISVRQEARRLKGACADLSLHISAE